MCAAPRTGDAGSQLVRHPLIFGVNPQAIGQWLHQGIPHERARAISGLAAATDLLVRYLKRDRISVAFERVG